MNAYIMGKVARFPPLGSLTWSPRLVSERGELVVERQARSVGGPAAAVMLLPPANLLEVAGKGSKHFN